MIQQRDISLDIAKALGIVLMMAGHRLWDTPLRVAIYSFHMPLFFLIAGYLFKPMQQLSDSKIRMVKDVKRLIVPYVVTAGIVVLWWIGVALFGGENHILHRCVAAFWGEGFAHHAKYWGDMPSIGAIWFLLAMFWCKQTYNFIDFFVGKYAILVCLLIAFIAAKLRNIIGLPWSIWDGLGYLPFYAIGYLYKQHQLQIKPMGGGIILFVCCACWIGNLYMLYNEQLTWWNSIVAMLGAIGASYLIMLVARWMARCFHQNGVKALAWIGANSLTILCLHLLDLDCRGMQWLGLSSEISLYIEILILPLIILLLSYSPLAKLIFGITPLTIQNKR